MTVAPPPLQPLRKAVGTKAVGREDAAPEHELSLRTRFLAGLVAVALAWLMVAAVIISIIRLVA